MRTYIYGEICSLEIMQSEDSLERRIARGRAVVGPDLGPGPVKNFLTS